MSPSWFVYLLRCADGTLYCGITNDLVRRHATHAAGRVKYTRGRLPVDLVWHEPSADRSSASRREREIKTFPRERKLALLAC